jgi:hypothetical protein
VLHAVWNAVAHGVSDRPLVLGLPPSVAWPFVLASALVHVIYMLLLWARRVVASAVVALGIVLVNL